MKFLLLFFSITFLASCTEDTPTEISTNIVYTGNISFLSGDETILGFRTMYIKKTTTDSVYKAETAFLSTEFTPTELLATNNGQIFMVSENNLASSGVTNNEEIKFQLSKIITTDTISDITIDRRKNGYVSTDKGIYKYDLSTLTATDTINFIANKLTYFGDSIIAVNKDSIYIYEDQTKENSIALPTTLITKEILAQDSNIYILASDSNIYLKNSTTGLETPITTTSNYTSMSLSNGSLIIATKSKIISLDNINQVYSTSNKINKINATRGAVVSFETDSLGINSLKLIDIESMRKIASQSITDSVIILEK